MKSAAVIIFENFEEIEATAPIDILRRAGISVCVATMNGELETAGRSGIKLVADKLFSEIKNDIFDAVIISGGPGTANVSSNKDLLDFIKKHDIANRIVAAICAAPTVLKNAGALVGKTCACHASKEAELSEHLEKGKDVVSSKNAITSRGAGTAIQFSLEIVKTLLSEEIAKDIAKSICF